MRNYGQYGEYGEEVLRGTYCFFRHVRLRFLCAQWHFVCLSLIFVQATTPRHHPPSFPIIPILPHCSLLFSNLESNMHLASESAEACTSPFPSWVSKGIQRSGWGCLDHRSIKLGHSDNNIIVLLHHLLLVC